MTVISEPIESIVGADNATRFMFWSTAVRETEDGSGLVTVAPIFLTAVNGVLTTPDLDPGPATVRIGPRAYDIEIPHSATPIRLWPLVEAGMPVQPAEFASAVRNGGGAARLQVMTAAAYAALVSTTTPDPGSIFFVF